MRDFLFISIGFVIGLLASLPAYILILRNFIKLKVIEIECLKEIHREEFAAMIAKMNHQGQIKEGVTASGLMSITLWALEQVIFGLDKLLKEQDWNTKDYIIQLRGIVMVELTLLHKKLEDFIKSKRDILREYNKNQE